MRRMLAAPPNASAHASSFYLALDDPAAYAPLLQELDAPEGALAHL